MRDLRMIATQLVHEERYGEALGVVDQMAAIDGGDDYVQAVRPLLEDKILIARYGVRPPLIGGCGRDERPPRRSGPRRADASVAAIRAKLDSRLPHVRLPAISFADAIQVLREQSGLPIAVKWKELEVAGFDRELPVTVDLTDRRFSEVLEIVLESASTPTHRLEYVIDHGVVAVSTADDVSRVLVTRVYDVRDLLPLQPPPPLPDAGAGTHARNQAAAVRARWNEAVAQFTAELHRAVDPASWHACGDGVGTVDERDGRFTVAQTPRNHEAVAAYLARTRQSRASIARLRGGASYAVPAVLLVLVTALVARRLRTARAAARGACRKCGYDIRASVGRCPECGEAIAADLRVRPDSGAGAAAGGRCGGTLQ